MAASTISPADRLRLRLRPAIAALAMALALPMAAQAARFEAEVVRVTDGDTVTVRRARGGAEVTVRIQGMDAPEICQAGGREARAALSGLALHRRVTVVTRGRDTYQRTLARLQLDGQDVGAWMVVQGHAWSYRFRGRGGPYQEAQAQARFARRGLWAQPGPEEPRSFRQRHGSCYAG